MLSRVHRATPIPIDFLRVAMMHPLSSGDGLQIPCLIRDATCQSRGSSETVSGSRNAELLSRSGRFESLLTKLFDLAAAFARLLTGAP